MVFGQLMLSLLGCYLSAGETIDRRGYGQLGIGIIEVQYLESRFRLPKRWHQ